MLRRRGFFAGIAAALAAPAIIRTPGLLMPVKPLMLEEGVRFTGFYSLIPIEQLPNMSMVLQALSGGGSMLFYKYRTEPATGKPSAHAFRASEIYTQQGE